MCSSANRVAVFPLCVVLANLKDVAELHNTKRVREMAVVLREAVAAQGASLRDGDHAERLVAERVLEVAQQLGVTPRTAMTSYLTDELVRRWGTNLAAQLRDVELAAHDAEAVQVAVLDGVLVLAAFGVCGVLAMHNIERREHIDPMVVIKDASDSTVHLAVPLYEAGGQPVEIGGMTIFVGRKVIGMTIEALRNGWWSCTCQEPHRTDGGCGLQDRLVHELALLGGWQNAADA
jgi:hypothetical protein